MQAVKLKPLLAVAVLATFGVSAPTAHSAPMGEGVGVCYAFKGDKLKSQQPCIISQGYGAGGSYTTLTIGKKSYNFEYPSEYDHDEEDYWDYYFRNLFYQRISILQITEGQYLTCFYHKPYDMCYKF